ncbi:MAG TPA: hypothetical protein VFB79_08090 [Candidatus Angelobacter sp.]|nr:hypothetical protein [Candidatus Angelobacter sp.]
MRFSGETERSKRSESINQDGQKQDGKKLNKMAAVLLLTIFALVSGCSGKKDQKAIIDALNKGMNHDRIMVYLPLGRVGPACSSLNVESKPVPDQVVYAGAQKAGLITITPDGPNFWKVELVNPTPQMTDAFKRVSHNTKDGCDAMALSFSIANKKVAEIQNVHKIADNQSEVEFTWKWTLVSFGPKFVNALSSRELAGLNEHLRNPVLDQHFDPSFNIADMAQTGAPQTAKMIVTKSGNDLEAELSSDGKIAEAKRKYEALQAQLTQLENSMPKPGEWVRAAATDKMDGSESVQFKTFSENKVQLSEGEERLLLAIGCDQHLHL